METGEKIALYRQTVEDYGICPDREFTREEWDAVIAHNGAVSAKMRAVRIVAASAVSKKDLQQRLVQKGETLERSAEAVAWMEELGLLDDAETARQIVARCIAKGYGPARAKQALYEKKIPKQYWDAALMDYPDQSADMLTFLRKKISDPRDRAQVKKAVDALLRRGHSYAQIRRSLQRLDVDPDEIAED